MGFLDKSKALKVIHGGRKSEGRSLTRSQNKADLLTIREACELLRVSRTTLWRWIKAEKIAIIRLGTVTKPLVRIHATELQKVVIQGHVSFE